MKKRTITMTGLSMLAVGAALAQTPAFAKDQDLRTSREQFLGHRPDLIPDWTWMTEVQARQILKGNGYSDVSRLERHGAFWKGKATKEGVSSPVAVNRYAEILVDKDAMASVVASTTSGAEMRSEIGPKWNKFSAKEIAAMKDNDDLASQVESKYSLDKQQARRDVEAFAKGRQL